MKSDFVKKNFISQVNAKGKTGYVDYGYGQVEPNHLSAQRTSQIYAQLPADKAIEILEQGQFVKYDYASGLVNFTGKGEWMLVFNEIKLYRDNQDDCEFAMIKDNYQARIYSPYGADKYTEERHSRYYNGVDAEGNNSITVGEKTYHYDDVTAAPDPYEVNYNEDPYGILSPYTAAKMPEGTTMVPRVFKTNVGDIMTTNLIADQTLSVGNLLTPGADGILTTTGAESADMIWQVAKLTTMLDHQKGVKIIRIK